jgi:hypothetical protein
MNIFRTKILPTLFLLIPSLLSVLIVYIFIFVKDEYFSLNVAVDKLDSQDLSALKSKTKQLEDKISRINTLDKTTKNGLLRDFQILSNDIQSLPVQKAGKAVEYKDVLALRKDQLGTLNSFLLTMLQLLGAFFFIVTAYFSWRNIKTADQQQISERLGEAFKNLAEDKPLICLGAIYLLERVAQDSPSDRMTIVEALAAFIREKSLATTPVADYSYAIQKSMDVILEYRKNGYGLKKRKLNLQGAYLVDAILNGACLDEVNLENANLRSTQLKKANLSKAILNDADLSSKADLSGANLQYAQLIKVDFSQSGLAQANLSGADVTDAIFDKAELAQAKFTKACGLEIQQLITAENWRNADYDNEFKEFNSDHFSQ